MSKGLPGFLRRSLRRTTDYDEEDETENADGIASTLERKFVSGYGTSADSVVHTTVDEDSMSALDEHSGIAEQSPDGATVEESSVSATDRCDSVSRVKNASNTSDNQTEKHSDSWVDVASHAQSYESRPQNKTYRETQFEKVLTADVVNMVELRKLAWNGIPHVYRAQVWKLLLAYLPANASRRDQTVTRKRAEYRDAIAQHYDLDDDARTLSEQETLRQVLVDVPRTQPDIPLFRSDRIKRALSRLLYIWAMRHPASSYVQGINDLATPLLAVFLADYYFGDKDKDFAASSNPSVTVLDGHIMNHCSDDRLGEVEADVYWCLTNLLAGIQDHYTADQPGVQRMVGRLEELVNRIDSDLTRHIRDDTGIQFLQFSFKWMNCLLLREFHLKCVFRLWDTYIAEKDGFEDFHVYVCAAFMCQFSGQLQEMTFDELFGFMQAMPTGTWTDTEIEVLLSQAYVLSTLFKGSDAHLSNWNGL